MAPLLDTWFHLDAESSSQLRDSSRGLKFTRKSSLSRFVPRTWPYLILKKDVSKVEHTHKKGPFFLLVFFQRQKGKDVLLLTDALKKKEHSVSCSGSKPASNKDLDGEATTRSVSAGVGYTLTLIDIQQTVPSSSFCAVDGPAAATSDTRHTTAQHKQGEIDNCGYSVQHELHDFR